MSTPTAMARDHAAHHRTHRLCADIEAGLHGNQLAVIADAIDVRSRSTVGNRMYPWTGPVPETIARQIRVGYYDAQGTGIPQIRQALANRRATLYDDPASNFLDHEARKAQYGRQCGCITSLELAERLGQLAVLRNPRHVGDMLRAGRAFYDAFRELEGAPGWSIDQPRHEDRTQANAFDLLLEVYAAADRYRDLLEAEGVRHGHDPRQTTPDDDLPAPTAPQAT